MARTSLIQGNCISIQTDVMTPAVAHFTAMCGHAPPAVSFGQRSIFALIT